MNWPATLSRLVGKSADMRLHMTPHPARAAASSPADTSASANFAALALLSLALALVPVQSSKSADWPRFRGPSGSGISDDATVPLVWSDSKNLKWKTPLPGPGSSSPIVSGRRVFVTCYSGYGVNADSPGSPENLRRHLLCVNRSDGSILWSKSIEAVLPEDPYRGYIAGHGYASNTPVTDGERVYVFFGKTGVLAFDFEGNQLWQVSVGTESSMKGWGSGASPILCKDLLIVNAAEESESIRALDKMTGKEVWKAEAAGLELTYGTPLVVDLDDGRKEIVIAVPWEAWGLDPDTGKLNWHAETNLDQNVAPSAVADDGIVYAFGGFSKGSIAIRAGGKGDVTQTHVLWSSRYGSYVPSPVIRHGNIYWVSEEGIAHCAEAKTGKLVYRERLARTGGGSLGGRPFYASAVLVDNRLYCVSRTGGTFVLAAKPQFEQLARNQLDSNDGDFNGSPAISDGQVFLRSNRFLYCIQDDQAEGPACTSLDMTMAPNSNP